MFVLAYCTRSTSGNCCRHIIFCPISFCHFICMTCSFNCIIIDCFFFFVLCLSFSKFFVTFLTILGRLCWLFDCESTNCADIAISAVPVAIVIFCIVLLIEMNIMMIASCTFIHNTWSCFYSTTFCATIFCISIASTSRFNSYTWISMFCTSVRHINRIYKYSTPHKLIIIVCFFAITHCFHLRLINVKARSICAIIRVIIALFKCISETIWIIFIIIINIALTRNKSKVSCHRYIHLSIIFDCHCCNRMIFERESNLWIALIANWECHSTKRNWFISLAGYGVIYFNSFNLTRAEIVA